MDPFRRNLVAMFILEFASLIALLCTSSVDAKVILNLNQNALVFFQYFILQKGRGGSYHKGFNHTIENPHTPISI